MKKILIIMSVVLGTSIASAAQGDGSCKSYAEKVAMTLFSIEGRVSELNGVTTSVRLSETGAGTTSAQWEVTFAGSQGVGDSEWGKIYKVNVTNLSDTTEEACYLDAVEVIKAG